MKSLGIWLVREQALALGEKLASELGGTLVKPWQHSNSAKQLFAESYKNYSHWIIVGAAGIAVRFLSDLIADKHSDPAVVVVDEAGRFAVSLLCGHEGGGNQLAYSVASTLGAVPVVTTATESLKPLVLGIGCRKAVRAEQIDAAVTAALGDLELTSVRHVATIDLKRNEPGLLEFCKRHDLPLLVLSAGDIRARGWVTEPSAWVKAVTGADGVCEPCALISSLRGKLLVSKTVLDGVAVAVASDQYDLESCEAEPLPANSQVPS